jgi:integrase
VKNIVTRGKSKVYYLRTFKDGKAGRIRLLRPDGTPILGARPDGRPLSRQEAAEARQAAEAAAAIVLAPLRQADKAEQLRTIKNSLRDAEAAAAEAEADLRNSAATLGDGWDLFMTCPKRPASCRRFKAGDAIPRNSTAGNYEAYYRAFLTWLARRRPKPRLLSHVTPEHAAAFLESVEAEFAAGTHNKYLTFLRMFFSVLMDAGKITVEKNPFDDCQPVEGSVNSKRVLSREQVAMLIDAAEGDLKLLIALGYGLGLRMGDCCTLRWAELDLEHRVCRRLPNKTARVKNKDRVMVTVGIPAGIAAALSALPRNGEYVLPELAERYESGRMKKVHDDIRRLFESIGLQTREPGTGAAHHYEGKKKVYAKGRPRAVVHYGFHSLRYAHVSHSIAAGTPLAVVQRNAGHANPAMTEAYIRINASSAAQYAKALDLPSDPPASEAVLDVTPTNGIRERAHVLIDTLSEEQIEELIKHMQGEETRHD